MGQGYTKGIPIDVDNTLSQDSDLLVSSQKAVKTYVDTEVATKQDTLVSATNIKTINGSSVLGSGNLVVTGSGASWGGITGTLSSQTDLQTALDGKVNDTGNESISGNKTFTDLIIVESYDKTGTAYIQMNDALDNPACDLYHSTGQIIMETYPNQDLVFSTADDFFLNGKIITNSASKTTPIDADSVITADSADGGRHKKTTWTNVKSFLKTYFDTLYQVAGSYLTSANIVETITNGVTTNAPSENAVFDALALKEPVITNGFGISGTTTKSVSLSSAQAFCTAETTLSATAYADITGASITLDAGTWLIMATVNGASQTTTATSMIVAITDSANALVAESTQDIPAGTATVRTWANLSISAIVTPVGSTTYKLRGARGQTTRTGNWIASDGTGQATANNGSNNSDKSTSIRAIRIA